MSARQPTENIVDGALIRVGRLNRLMFVSSFSDPSLKLLGYILVGTLRN